MKRALLFAVVAIVSCIIGFFMGYELAHTAQPYVVTRNLTRMAIPQVTVQTDRGESHVITNLASRQSSRVEISPQKKDVWIVAKLADGREIKSEKTYVPSQGILFASISEESIDLDFEL